MGPHVPWTSGVISEVDPTVEDPKQACTMQHAPASWCSLLHVGSHVWWLWARQRRAWGLGFGNLNLNPKPKDCCACAARWAARSAGTT